MPEKTRMVADVLRVTPQDTDCWQLPTCQRGLSPNKKSKEVSQYILDSGEIPGVVTLGVIDSGSGDIRTELANILCVLWLLDGQHRRDCFKNAGIETAEVVIKYKLFATEEELGAEFVRLNGSIVRLRPDDILRGMEGQNVALQHIRSRCPFVGYDMIRRRTNSPVLSMSVVLRSWQGSTANLPVSSAPSTESIANRLALTDAVNCGNFLDLAYQAWGREREHDRLWGALNLTLCMWLYRRLVMNKYSKKVPLLSQDQFRKCLLRLTTSTALIDWLNARTLNDVSRAPTYRRIKELFGATLREEFQRRVALPDPDWAKQSRRVSDNTVDADMSQAAE